MDRSYRVVFCRKNLERFGDDAFRKIDGDLRYQVILKDCLYKCPAGRSVVCLDTLFCYVGYELESADGQDELVDIILNKKRKKGR